MCANFETCIMGVIAMKIVKIVALLGVGLGIAACAPVPQDTMEKEMPKVMAEPMFKKAGS